MSGGEEGLYWGLPIIIISKKCCNSNTIQDSKRCRNFLTGYMKVMRFYKMAYISKKCIRYYPKQHNSIKFNLAVTKNPLWYLNYSYYNRAVIINLPLIS